jgi:hypothetical protein
MFRVLDHCSIVSFCQNPGIIFAVFCPPQLNTTSGAVKVLAVPLMNVGQNAKTTGPGGVGELQGKPPQKMDLLSGCERLAAQCCR